MPIDSPDTFEQRHIGPDEKQQADMLRVIGVRSLDALIDAALPASIRLKKPLQLPPAETEHEYLDRLRTVAAKNQRFKSFIGMGYYGTITPSVILRNLFENPSWYTPYTPYQAEIAQGRLESLLNFQTMVRDLTAMEIATASLLDEATAAGEAMTLLHRVQGRQGAARAKYVLGVRAHVSAGARRPEGARGAARHHDRVWAIPRRAALRRRRVRRVRAVTRRLRRGRSICAAFIARAHEQNVLVAVGSRSARPHDRRAAGRDGRRRRRRQRAAVRRADGLRRTARGVSGDARDVRQAGPGPHHRRVGRFPRQSAPTAWRCRRASSTSGARRRRRTSARRRRCSRTSRRCTACITGLTASPPSRGERTPSPRRSKPRPRRWATRSRTRRTSTRCASRCRRASARRRSRSRRLPSAPD